MTKEKLEGKFDQLKGALKKTWGNLTDDDIAYYNGERDIFFGKLKEKYGLAKEEAEKQVKELEETLS